MKKIIIACNKCGEDKERKCFQRDSKEYRSCNDCAKKGKQAIEESFAKAFKLLDKEWKV